MSTAETCDVKRENRKVGASGAENHEVRKWAPQIWKRCCALGNSEWWIIIQVELVSRCRRCGWPESAGQPGSYPSVTSSHLHHIRTVRWIRDNTDAFFRLTWCCTSTAQHRLFFYRAIACIACKGDIYQFCPSVCPSVRHVDALYINE